MTVASLRRLLRVAQLRPGFLAVQNSLFNKVCDELGFDIKSRLPHWPPLHVRNVNAFAEAIMARAAYFNKCRFAMLMPLMIVPTMPTSPWSLPQM